MLKKGLLVLAVLVVVLVAVVATRPSEFQIQRTTRIGAPPDLVYPHVADLRQWAEWSPWEKLDPSMKKTYGGAPAGPGATYEWVGNDKVGEGKMTITSLRPSEEVEIQLEFFKPWQATNQTRFTFKADNPVSTTVTWLMEGENNFGAKAFGLVMDMDAMVGKDFEAGLTALKTLAENEARDAAEAGRAPSPAEATDEPAQDGGHLNPLPEPTTP